MTTALLKTPGPSYPTTESSEVLIGYDDRRMQHLAREIAMDILPLQEILRLNMVTEQEWAALERSQAFQILLRRETEYWNSALSTAERIRIKSLTVVEDALLTAAKVINNDQEGAAGRARMLEAVAKIANLGDRPQVAGEGGRVLIQINMGEDNRLTKEVTPQVTVIEAQPEPADE